MWIVPQDKGKPEITSIVIAQNCELFQEWNQETSKVASWKLEQCCRERLIVIIIWRGTTRLLDLESSQW